MQPIKVLIVDDSILFRELLVQSLSKDPAIQVVGTAKDPFEARDAILAYHPWIEFLRKLMPQYPLRVVVISALSNKVFDAMDAGAVDFVAKPTVSGPGQMEDFIKNELLAKIKIAATAKIESKKSPVMQQQPRYTGTKSNLVVAIGASTGGTEAIFSVAKGFGADIPGIVVVQHMPPGFTEMYAQRLNSQTKLRVKEARPGDGGRRGTG